MSLLCDSPSNKQMLSLILNKKWSLQCLSSSWDLAGLSLKLLSLSINKVSLVIKFYYPRLQYLGPYLESPHGLNEYVWVIEWVGYHENNGPDILLVQPLQNHSERRRYLWVGNFSCRVPIINSSTYLSVSVTKSVPQVFVSMAFSLWKASKTT